MIAQGTFREDLYFRIKVFPIVIPPLRKRRCDIPALAQHFLHKKACDMKLGYEPTLTDSGLEHLLAYDWPGNVRELENAVERALILAQGQPLTFTDLQHSLVLNPKHVVENKESPLKLDQVIARHISDVLKMAEGRIELCFQCFQAFLNTRKLVF